MKIHPLWFICILVRLGFIFLIRSIKKIYYSYISIILFAIGGGFMYKGILGSNNEIQINKVFWHETRFLHGMLYILSGFYLFKKNINMTSLVLLLDLISSFFYRSYEIKKMF